MKLFSRQLNAAAFGCLLILCLTAVAAGQKRASAPVIRGADGKPIVVTKVDDAGFAKLLLSAGKPRMINFWATWCDPCREEFPELVKLDAEYRGRIDFITVTLDDLAEINRDVPKFLAEMKATMPTYLLKSLDESKAISAVSPDWTGGLPFTVLIDQQGKTTYFRQGKVVPAVIRAEIGKLLPTAAMPDQNRDH